MKLLVGLQDCDRRIMEIEQRMREAPLKMKELETGLNTFETQMKEEKELLESYHRQRRETERELQLLESRIQKSQEKLANIKSNKEYRAALKEIEDLKGQKSSLEDKALEMMERIEEAESKGRESQARLYDLRARVEGEKGEILREAETLEKEIIDLSAEREKFAHSLDEDILKRYDFLRERKGGIAVSPVIHGVCQTCHMGIPPQKFNELIRGDALLTCPNCMRIIYWGENEALQRGHGAFLRR